MRPILISVIRQIVVKFCVALAFAATLALASNSSLELGLRYFAAISLLISLGLAGMAIIQGSAAQGTLSYWDQALIFSVIATVAHFLAGHME